MRALSSRNFRLYLVAQATHSATAWGQRVAIDWFVFEVSGSVAAVGLAIALQLMPYLFFAIPGGFLADRYGSRRLLVALQLAMAGLSAGLALLALTGVARLWMVYLIVIAMGMLSVVIQPARSVLVYRMVGASHLSNAISLNSFATTLGSMLGPVLGGVLIASTGSGWALLSHTGGCLVWVVLVLCVRLAEFHPAPPAAAGAGGVLAGVRESRRNATVRWALILATAASLLVLPMPAVLTGAAATFGSGASGYGLYTALLGCGAAFGAIMSARRLAVRMRTVVIAGVAYGGAIAVTGLVPTQIAFLAGLAVVGFAKLQFMTAVESVVQVAAPASLRGRVMAIYLLMVNGAYAIGSVGLGWIAEVIGPLAAMSVVGGVQALVAIAAGFVLAHRNQLRLRFSIRPGTGFVTIVSRSI